jgi:hypothetical protein
MKIMITDTPQHPCRFAFAQHLFEAGTVGGEGEPAFSVTGIIGKDHPANKLLADAEEKVAKEKWGAKADGILKQIRAAGKGVVKDGDSKAEYAGFEGNMFVSTRSPARPTVIDRDRSPLVAADGRPYSGCYANVQVEVWAQDNSYGKRINAQLLGVQFVKDGDAFGGGAQPSNPDDFGDLSADEGEESLVD